MAFADAFAGSAGDKLDARTGWAFAGGTANAAEINGSNQLRSVTVGNSGSAYTATDCGSADHYAQCVWRGGNTGFAPCVRVTDNNNFIGVRAESAQFAVYARISAGFSSPQTYAATPSPGDALKLVVTGSTVELYVNGVLRISTTTTTLGATSLNAVTTCGLVARSTGADPWIDDWESTTPGGGGGGNPWYYRLQQAIAAERRRIFLPARDLIIARAA